MHPKIRHRGCHEQEIGIGALASTAASISFAVRTEPPRPDGRSLRRWRCGDEHHLCARVEGGLGQGKALLAGERLVMTRTGSIGSCVPPAVTTRLRPASVPLRPSARRMAEDFGRLEHASDAAQTRGEVALGGSGEKHAAFLQDADIFLGGRVVVHPGVHRRGDQQRAVRRQGGDRQQVIGLPVGQFGEGVGGAGRDHQQVGGMSQSHVQDVRLAAPQIGIREGVARP